MVTVIKGAISLLLMVIKAKLILQLRLDSLVKEIKRLLRSKLVDPGISHASVQLIEIPSHSVSTHSSITSNLPTGAEPHSRTEMPSRSWGEAQRQGECPDAITGEHDRLNGDHRNTCRRGGAPDRELEG